MYCSACGKNIPHDANFCRHCGARVTSTVPPPAAAPELSQGPQASDHDILVEEIGKLVDKTAEMSEKVAELIGVDSRPGTDVAGRFGAQLSASFLSNDTYEVVVQLSTSTASIYATVREIFHKMGKLVDSQDSSGSIELRGIVGSGFLNMNPALVSIAIWTSESGRAHARIRGTAKEGLIKQHAGKKAVESIAQQLLSAH